MIQIRWISININLMMKKKKDDVVFEMRLLPRGFFSRESLERGLFSLEDE